MIVFVHLLNDRSGSPQVLASVIEALATQSEARLVVGSGGTGRLDEVKVPITRYWYRRSRHRLVTLGTYLISQACLIIHLTRARLPPDAVIYINTLLPFGAAIYGALTRRRVVYHLHEVSVTPALLRWFLTRVARISADRLIYVSDFHRSSLPIMPRSAVTIYNALNEEFSNRASSSEYAHRRDGSFDVLMITSLRDYKGVPELLSLILRLSARADIRFHLVANDLPADILRYFGGASLPRNLTVHQRTDDPGIYYARASLVLNLSRPDLCVETFGLTLLEAMAFGVPVIAPPVGGPLEVVQNGRGGYLIDSRNGDALAAKVLEMADDEALCLQLSEDAREAASRFSRASFVDSVRSAVRFEGSLAP